MKRQWWKSLLAFVADHLAKHRLTENPGPRSLRNLRSCLWNKWAPTSPSSQGELCSPSQAKSESHAASALFGQCWSSHSHGSSCTPRSPRAGMSWMGLYIYVYINCMLVSLLLCLKETDLECHAGYGNWNFLVAKIVEEWRSKKNKNPKALSFQSAPARCVQSCSSSMLLWLGAIPA